MDIIKEALTVRKPENDLSKIFLGRWSPRAMSGEAITQGELFSLFEAAKWAPSSYNEQPWRVLYALRETPEWDLFYNLMVEFNQGWAKNSGALLLFISKTVSSKNGKPISTHSYDTGAAWQSLALQGSMNGLVVHGMSGFDYERAKSQLKIPDEFQVEAMAAVGRPAPKETLPQEMQSSEVPSERRPLSQSVSAGIWSEKLN